MYPQLIQQFLKSEDLPHSYGEDAEKWILPFIEDLKAKLAEHEGGPFLLGINGAQGTGKSTFSKLLSLLMQQDQIQVCCLSLDDFYLTKQTRLELAKTVHPLLATRGVPGTHDIPLLRECFSRLLDSNGRETVPIPKFDKAIDDRIAEAEFRAQQLPVDLVILEGWCVGACSTDVVALSKPLNQLETEHDPDGNWRIFVNDCLREDYEPLFAQLDALLVLQAPSFEQVFEWRGLQEQKLKQNSSNKSAIMHEVELQRFIQHYERITRRCLEQLPERADVLFQMDKSHRITARKNSKEFAS